MGSINKGREKGEEQKIGGKNRTNIEGKVHLVTSHAKACLVKKNLTVNKGFCHL